MLRALAILVLAAGVVAATAGAASSLTVTSQALQAGVDSTLDCDADGVTVSYGLVFSTNLGTFGWAVAQVTVAGIDAACVGASVSVALSDATGGSLAAPAAQAVGTGMTSLTYTLSPIVLAAAVSRVDVAITGGTSAP